MNRNEVILFDAEFPWGLRVCSICRTYGFQAKSMHLSTGYALVDWPHVAAVFLQATKDTGSAVLDAIYDLQTKHHSIKCLVYLRDRIDDEWLYRELGAIWTFSSIFELDAVERILKKLAVS